MPLSVEQLRAYSFPFRKGPSGYFARASGRDVITEAIETVVGTAKGERVMRPTFGCDIHKRVFQPNDQPGNVTAASDIKAAITAWVPGIEVTEVNATADEHRVAYTVRFRERSTGQVQKFDGETQVRR